MGEGGGLRPAPCEGHALNMGEGGGLRPAPCEGRSRPLPPPPSLSSMEAGQNAPPAADLGGAQRSSSTGRIARALTWTTPGKGRRASAFDGAQLSISVMSAARQGQVSLHGELGFLTPPRRQNTNARSEGSGYSEPSRRRALRRTNTGRLSLTWNTFPLHSPGGRTPSTSDHSNMGVISASDFPPIPGDFSLRGELMHA